SQDSLVGLDANGELKQMLDTLMSKGPNVTLAVLNAFTQPDTLAVLLTEEPVFSQLCSDIIAAIASDIGQTTAADLNATLCYASMTAFNSVFDDLGISGVSEAVSLALAVTVAYDVQPMCERRSRSVNQTIWTIMGLVTGAPYYNPANFTALAVEVEHLIVNFERMMNATGTTLAELLSLQDMLTDLMEKHEYDWEPVLDMLNENYLGAGALGFMRAMEEMMNNTQIHEMLGPGVHVTSVIVRSLYDEMSMMGELFSKDSPLLQLVSYSTTYAPELVKAVMDMGNNGKIDMVYELASSRDPLRTLCDGHMIQNMGLPAYVPVVDLENSICETNWTRVVMGLGGMSTMVEVMIQEMLTVMDDLQYPNVTYSFETDWRELVDYTNRIAVMMTSESDIGTMLMWSGPWSIVNYANFTQLGAAVDVAMKSLEGMSEDSLHNFAGVVVRMMENIDEQMKENIPVFGEGSVDGWRMFKHYVKLIDDYTTLQSTYGSSSFQSTVPLTFFSFCKIQQDMIKFKEFISVLLLNEMLDMYPPEIRNMVGLAAGAYLEFIDVLKRIILNPDQAPSCGGTTLTSYLDLAPDSSFGQLEETVCTTNWTALAMEMGNMQPEVQRISENIAVLMADLSENKIDPEVNWTQVVDNMFFSYDKLSHQLANMTWPSNFDLSPFNMSAIDMKWKEFVEDMDQLQQLDTDSLMKVLSDLQNIIFSNTTGMLGMAEDGNTFLSLLQAESYMSYHFLDFSRIITEPDQFMSLCSNLTLFSWVVAADDSVIDTALLQQTVCNLNLNLTALMEELRQNWFSKVMEPGASLTVDFTELTKTAQEYSALLESVITHPPTFTLFPNGEHWMNATLYETEWKRFGESMENIFSQYQNPTEVMTYTALFLHNLGVLRDVTPEVRQILDAFSTIHWPEIVKLVSSLSGNTNSIMDYTVIVRSLVSGLSGISEVRQAMYVMDASLDLLQQLLEEMEDGPKSFEGFPNLQTMYSLLEQFPELFEMLAYTSTNQPQQVEAWGSAMASWDTFCSTNPMTLMTAPPGSSLDVVDVFARLCSINITDLMTELNSYRGFQRLQTVIEGGNITEPFDLAAFEGRLTTFIGHVENLTSSSPDMDLNLRILNASVWEGVFERLGSSLNNTAQAYMTPFALLEMLTNLTAMFPELKGLEGTMRQTLAVTDVILDQVLRSLQGGTLEELFETYPTMQSLLKLTDSLPEIVETLAYTGLYSPEKIADSIQMFSTFESFCGADLSQAFTVPAGVDFDMVAWQTKLCAVNLTQLMEELAEYQGTKEIEAIFQPNATYSVNVTAISQKVEEVIQKLTNYGVDQTDMTFGARFLNVSAWEGVAAHLESWVQNASSMWSTVNQYQFLLSTGVLSSLESIPELNTALQYTSAILDMIAVQFENSLKSLPEAFEDYPNLKTILSLLEDVPEIFEIFGYTTLQHQEQLARWTGAMASWDTFCSADPTTLMTAPPGSPLDVNDVFSRLCSINITELMIELNSYQGQDRLNALMSGANVTEPVNITALVVEVSALVGSIETLVSSPMDTAYNLRLLNATVWEGVLERLGSQLNETQQKIMSPEYLVGFYEQLFAGSSEMEAAKVEMDRIIAIVDVVVEQMLRSLQGGSVKDLFDNYPTAQKAFGLLDSLPEIYEMAVYTALFGADKVSANTDAFTSLESFCTTDMSTIFTVPEGVDFNLTVWQMGFCTLNLTVLMDELAEYAGVQEVANMFAPNTTAEVNLTSVIVKIESLVSEVSKLASGETPLFNWSDRFLNVSLWENAMANLEKWSMNASQYWMSPERYMMFLDNPELMNQMGVMNSWAAVSMVVMDKMLQYENVTNFSLDKLFVGAPELQRLIQLMEEPGILEVFFESANSPQFEPVWVTNNVTVSFAMLCDPSTTLSKYLTVPDGVSVDLVGLKSQLCALSPQLIEQEFMDFLDIDRFEAAMNGSIPVDWAEYMRQQERVSAMITRWTESPPTFTLPADWQNETYWLGILERYAMQRQDPANIFTELQSFLEKMSAVPGDPFHQMGLVMETVLRLINENVVALQNQNLTLDNMFERVPVLQQVMNALGVEGELLDTLREAPVKSMELLIEAMLSDGSSAYRAICETGQIQDMLELPPTFNTTALYGTVCLKNTTTVVENLVSNLDIQGLIDGLESMSAVANWSAVFKESEELQRNIENLIQNPPPLAAGRWAFPCPDALKQVPGFEAANSILKSAAVVTEFLDDLVNRLTVDGMTLDLASLFSESPSFVRLVDALLHTQPDLLTALSAIQLNPAKISEFAVRATQPDFLETLFCSESVFQSYFMVPDMVNIADVSNVLCSLNFTQLTEELSDNFMVDSLTRKFAMAMNESVPFNMQAYVATYLNFVEHINTLMGVKNVTFNGNNLEQAFTINGTLLLEALASVALWTLLPLSLGNSTDGQTVVLVLKILETYLHSLNQELGVLMEGPITLAAIVNNTEAGKIVMPFLTDPNMFEELLNLQLLPEKLSGLLMEPDAMGALCGPQLFSAFAYPSNESVALRQLQTSVCNTNMTVMMWQAIMGQANGYQLYLQFGRLSEEIAAGKVTVNASAISGEVEKLINMVMQLVSDYENGTRSAQDLLDWRAFSDIFDRFSASVNQRLMNITQWSGDMLSMLPDFEGKDFMVRTINTANIFMEIINDRLRDVIDNNVSMSTLLGHSQTLVDLMDAYLDVTQLSAQAWIDDQFSMERVLEMFVNTTMMDEMCKSNTLAAYLADSQTVPEIATTMATVMCSVTTTLPEAFRGFIDYTAIQEQLEMIWNMSLPVQPQFQRYQDNVETFAALVQQMIDHPEKLTVDPNLPGRFSYDSMLDTLMNITQHPEMIFRLLKTFGILVDGPLSSNDLENMLYGINAYIAQPLLMVTERLNHAGLTMSAVMNDPSKLLLALPVFTDYSTQFEVLASVYLQPTINIIWNNEEFRDNHFCSGDLPADVFVAAGLEPSIVDTLCQLPTTQWIEELQKHSASAMQIYTFVAKVQEAYNEVPRCHTHCNVNTTECNSVCSSKNADLMEDGSMNWMRLMTSLESLAKYMTPTDDQGNVHNMTDPMLRLWSVMQDAFLDKALHGAMNYLEMQDRMMYGEAGQEWLAFKQFLRFLNSAGQFMNTYLHGMTGQPGMVSLQSVLPDSERVAALIEDVFGQSSASEVLAASVNPQLFFELAYTDRLEEVACNPAKFNTMFMFEQGSNIAAIQQSLCAAATNRSTSLQELIDLFHAGDMLKQLDAFMSGNYSQMMSDFSLWSELFNTVRALITDLEKVQQGQFNATISMSWFSPILNTLMTLNQASEGSYEGLCENYVSFMGGTAWFQDNMGLMVLVTHVLEVSSSAAPFLPVLDDVACATVTNEGLDLAAGIEILKQHGLHNFFNQLSQLLTNGTEGTFRCHDLVHSGAQMFEVLNTTLMSGDLDFEQLGQCMQRGSSLFADVLGGINQIYGVLEDMLRLMDEDDFLILMSNSGELGDVLEFIMSILTQQKPVALKFEDLLANSTTVEDYLEGILKITPEAVAALLESSIQFNASMFLNDTVGEIAAVLCDPAALGEVMVLPSFSPVTISQLSNYLCSGDVNVTAAIFKDARQSFEYVGRLVSMITTDSTATFMASFTTNLVNLFENLQGMTALVDLVTGGFDYDTLRQNAEAIDRTLNSGSVQSIVDSLVAIVGDLQFLVPEEDKYIITDIQTLIRGLVGLDSLQSLILKSLQVSDLLKDVRGMRDYMINELDFSPEVADALLNSVYSIRVFLNASEIILSDDSCADKLHQFLILNGTKAVNTDITSAFCSLNTTQVTDLLEALMPELDVGDLVEKYVTMSGDQFLQSINMTETRVKDIVDKLDRGGEVLGKAAAVLQGQNGTRDPVLDDIFGITGEFDAVVSLEPVLCGRTSTVDDEFNLNSKFDDSGRVEFNDEDDSVASSGTTGSSSSSGGAEGSGGMGSQGGSTTARPQYMGNTVYARPDDFCREMYWKIRKSNMGAVVMAYLKPIMSGKILYTPDTPTTRAILREANWTFDTLSEVRRVAKIWSEKAPSLAALTDQASEMDRLRDVLSNRFVQSVLQSSTGVSTQSLMDGLDALNNNKINATEITAVQKVAELVYNYSYCLELNRFYPVVSEAEMEEKARSFFQINRFLGGIVFLDMPDDPSRQKRQADPQPNMPSHIKYKIRMDMDNVPSTHRLKDRLWMPDPEDGFAQDMRYMRGFLQLQDMIESAIVRLQAKDASFNATAISLQQMPFPCHLEDDYLHYLGSYLLPVVMTFAWLATLGIATHNLVYDRQNGQEESLRVMGMTSGLNFLAWILFTLVLMAVVSFVITIIFKYGGVFLHSNAVIVFLYLLAFCFSTTMIYFISAFFTRVTLAILSVLIIYFISFLPYVILLSAEVGMTFWQKTLACLSSTTAFSFGAVFITRLEEETTGLQWSNVNMKLSDSVSFSWMVYMMLIDSAIYLVLGWYIRNIKPGKYGKAQPWYFPVSQNYWCGGFGSSTHTLPPPGRSQNQDLYEPAPEGLDIGISVRGLRKTYSGQEEVVHSLDADIYHDQVTTLLGHNGAAKTTTMNMLVGVLGPSGGVVLVEGKKATGKTGLLGICPQHNTLYEYMTVQEHMEFYGGMKGTMSSVEQKREIRKLLHDVDLYHVKDVPALELSGGMQRRLCVALAFVGGSRTIVLDEPTSGVDPHARKNIWNLIIKNRPGRTILMSTHHLDEADMLSDRILVMHKGRLLCVGSPAFLKNQLGGGFKLTVNTFPTQEEQNEMEEANTKAIEASSQGNSHHSKVVSFIKDCIPGAAFIESVGTDLTVSLPQDGSDSSVLSHFFRQLDAKADELGVLGYGVSNTTLEEVFLRVTMEADNEVDTRSTVTSTDTESTSTDSENTILGSPHRRPQRTVRGASLKAQQLGALLLKRVHHYRRNWRMMFSTIVLPLIAFLCAMGFATLRPTTEDMPSLLMTPFPKDNSNTVLGRNFTATLTSPDPGVGTTCMNGSDAGFKCVDPSSWFMSETKEQICKCHDYSYECEDSTSDEDVQNMFSRPQVTLQNLADKNLDEYLVSSYSQYIDKRFGGWSVEPPSQEGNETTSVVKIWFNNKGHHAMASFFNAFSNNLLRTAVDPVRSSDYGITLYNHPLMLNEEQLEAAATDVGIAMVILLALSFIPSAFMVYLVNERLSYERQTQAISGVGTVLYWTASFLWDLFVYSVMLGLMVVIVVIFKTEGFYARENLGAFALLIFLYGWAVIPAMYCTLRLFSSGSSAYIVLFCTSMFLGLITSITLLVFDMLSTLDGAFEVCQYVFLIFPQFSLGMGLVSLVTNQVEYELLARFGEDTYVSPFSFDMLGWKFVALGIEGLVFFIAALLIHSRKARAQSMSRSMNYTGKDDEDVYNEHERVRASGSGDALVVRDLSKVYLRGMKKFCAVNRISFGVSKGECFGLLGVNGAGKTTTFKMLTGGTTPSLGQAILHGKKLDSLSLREEVGYCPQEDALDMFLSGRETLHFHARLRGFDSEQAKQVVAEQLKRLHLESYADNAVHTYSGGTKRKLNLAIAMLGDPPVLLL
ncbi:hypothetical protein BaRGS_00007836, partial [Batillaria attramentaria]